MLPIFVLNKCLRLAVGVLWLQPHLASFYLARPPLESDCNNSVCQLSSTMYVSLEHMEKPESSIRQINLP
jgi:hypothetical protein